MTLKWWLGLTAFSGSAFAIFLNLLIFLPVFRLAFIAKKSTIYVIAFFNVLSDLFQLGVTCFYLSGSVLANRYLFTGERMNMGSIFLGGFFINAWYMECLVQIVMAVNRFVVITLNQKNIFTFKTTMFIFLILLSTTIFSAVCVQWLFPCCQFIADHDVMSYMFVDIEGVYSYSNFMLVSYDIFCTSTSTLCYISVFLTIRSSKRKAPQNVQNSRGNQDVKYLFQFVFISIFYIFTWVLFELLPHIVPAEHPEWYAVVPILIILNCSSNSIIYLTMNREVQRTLQFSWLREKLGGGPSNSSANQVTPVIPFTN